MSLGSLNGKLKKLKSSQTASVDMSACVRLKTQNGETSGPQTPEEGLFQNGDLKELIHVMFLKH